MGTSFTVTTTSSVLFGQLALAIVHLNVMAAPTVNPVTVVLGLFAAVIVPVPLTTVHVPVPTPALLAPIVAVVVLQML